MTTNHLLPVPSAIAIETVIRKSLMLSGSSLLNHILNQNRPDTFVKSLSGEDFFWLVKRIGEEDCLPILALSTEEQWQYILDVEIWKRDILDPDRALAWLQRLGKADPERLASSFFAEENDLLSLLLLRTTEVVMKDGKEETDLPEGYFTLDGRFYIRAFRMGDQETIEGLLRVLAGKDHERYQALLYSLAGLIPAELEEELYRLRNGRIAEYGFFPFEEAIAVYAPLDPSVLRSGFPPLLPGRLNNPERGKFIPVLPLMHVDESSLVAETLSRIDDPVDLDRIRLEFSGICNRLIAADAFTMVDGPEMLFTSCTRTVAYLNLALENTCGRDTVSAKELLQKHPLLTIFRVGYGLAMNLHHEARRWRCDSWFANKGWDNDFWGSPWGGTLEGLLSLRPRFFIGEEAPEPYCDFQYIWHLEKARQQLNQIQALDRLLERLSLYQPMENSPFIPGMTFHFLLFNRWARHIIGMDISSAPISRTEAKRFFRTVRRNEATPPYRMSEFQEIFVADFMQEALDFKASAKEALLEALSAIWDFFRREYENVAEDGLVDRYSRYLLISPF